MPASNKKKQVLKLIIDNSINYGLIGISSHENDYRLVWAINSQFNIQFTRSENLVIRHPKQDLDIEFSRFFYNDENRYLTYTLISNRCPDGFLFPEIKNFDFLFQVSGEVKESDMKEIIRKLKTVSVISASFYLQPEKLKGIGRILPE